MTYSEFTSEKPILWGSIYVNGSPKFGMFKPEHNKHSNKICYHYYTPKGNKGTGGFTMRKAYRLFDSGKLTRSENDWLVIS